MSVLSIQNLSVTLEGRQLLNQISLSINAGEIVAILGANGAGKSTLLNSIIADTAQISNRSGEIIFCGQSIHQINPQQRARQMALLPQMSSLQFPFSVQEVVQLGRIPHASGHKIDTEIVKQALTLLDIAHLHDRLYTVLSGGEKQRVQLARVMTQIWREEDASQRLLLLDEPSSSLDLGHQQQLMTVVREFANQGVAVVLVAHDVNLASTIADRLLGLHNGNMIAQGKAEDVINPEVLKQLYGIDVTVIPHPKTGRPVTF